MIATRRLLLLVGGASLTAAGAVAAAERPVPTAAVQVTKNPDPVRAHSSPQIARSPENGELALAEVDIRGSRRCRVHISVDDGRTWFLGGDPTVKPFTDCSIGGEWGTYFQLFYGSDGTLYMPFAANDPKDFASDRRVDSQNARAYVPRNVYLARSTDGGRSFSTTLVYRAVKGNPDLGYAYSVGGAVDPSDPSRVYVNWAQGDWTSKKTKTNTVVAASDDGGKSFRKPVDITDKRGSEGGFMTVGSDGVLHAAFWSLDFGGKVAKPDIGIPLYHPYPVPLVYARSTDEGRIWKRSEIEPGYMKYYRPPIVVADPNSDAVYMAWHGSYTSRNLPLSLDKKDRTDVFLKTSADGGKSWGKRVRINDDGKRGVNQLYPGLAVAPNGRLDIAWYDGRLSPRSGGDPEEDKGFNDVFYASSSDQGKTVSANMRVSDRSIDRSIGVFTNNVQSAAPVGVTSKDDAAYFTWQDSRSGDARAQAEDVYMAKLARNGPESPAVGDDDDDDLLWLLLGVGAALALAGAVLLGATRLGRRPEAGPARG